MKKLHLVKIQFMAAIAIALSAFGIALFTAPGTANADGPRITVFSKTYDQASLVDGAGATTTVTAPGAALGDACVASFGVDLAGITVNCYVSAASTASVRAQNESTATVDLASTTLRVFIIPKGVR